MRRKRWIQLLIASVTGIALVGCSSSGGDDDDGDGGDDGGGNVVQFESFVFDLFDQTDEVSDPTPIEGIQFDLDSDENAFDDLLDG